MVMPFVRAAVRQDHLDAASVDRADMDAIGADDFHVLLDLAQNRHLLFLLLWH
jgi:hypothetical protein